MLSCGGCEDKNIASSSRQLSQTDLQVGEEIYVAAARIWNSRHVDVTSAMRMSELA